MSKILTRSSYVNDWIKKLKYRGIDTYIYNDLPDDLKDLSAHRRAIAEELVERIGKKDIGRGIWKIKQ